ncbi:MAG: GH3 auxin-responsive promoter family protein [Bacteroidales bacterium]|nr:GH3 auxin-responsive promoter family protein [Bacteroidales bacterium]HOY38407.1 GH3 auxin-responsive promoter family protein [Bacteroidales bacterium]HQP05122.1 GH3 auxin-responsive promoter family protein [Bacteroidales bacterium]
MPLVNSILNLINYGRLDEIEYFRRNPIEVQEKVFKQLIEKASDTVFGKKYDFKNISSRSDFFQKVPVHDYEKLKTYIHRIMNGEQNVLWHSEIKWFAKSSGTTSDKSKFIPISRESLEDCHFRSGKDIFAIFTDHFPDTTIFSGKTLTLGGSTTVNTLSENSYYGDLSAVLIRNLPFWTYFNRVPKPEIALMDEWEEKMKMMVETTWNKNVTNLIGVPSWFLVLLKKIIEYTGSDNICDVWPNLELFVYGGVNFLPYQEVYRSIIPSSDMKYLETYNASEGFFGIQDDLSSDDMLLMLDYGIYYEFLPMEVYGEPADNTVMLEDVECGKNYAMLISTNGGLWRYMIGDTVRFTSKNPYKIKITGRTKHFINAFGEELIVDNAQKALAVACMRTGAQVREFTAAPVYMGQNNKGAHEWLFEFITPPDSIEKFMYILDIELQHCNSDYEAKRYKDITLEFPKYNVLKEGCFFKWLQQKGKLGGQNKVPRLSNNRFYIEELLNTNKNL